MSGRKKDGEGEPRPSVDVDAPKLDGLGVVEVSA